MTKHPGFPLTDHTGTPWHSAAPKPTLTPLVRKPQPDLSVPAWYDRPALFVAAIFISFALFGVAVGFLYAGVFG